MGKRKQVSIKRKEVENYAVVAQKKKRNRASGSLNNNLLRQVKTMKYLGITIDKQLTFREHIKQATDKCRKLIFALSRSAKLNCGLSHKVLKKTIHGSNTAAPPIRSTG